MKEKTVPVTIRITPTMREKLRALAEAERRTLSQYVYLLVEKHLGEGR